MAANGARVYAVHGIATLVPWRIERFAGPWAARGWPVTTVDYGWWHAPFAARRARQVAERLAQNVPPGSVGIGYSNGAACLALAADLGAPFDRLILLHPALRRAWRFAPQLRRVDVVATPDDLALLAGRCWRFVTLGGLRDHPWGTLGRDGYRGDDARVHTHWLEGGGHGRALDWDVAQDLSERLYEPGQEEPTAPYPVG